MLNSIHDGSPHQRAAPWIGTGIVDSKRLQMFYASVKEGSFAAAAQCLSVTPSAISHAMKGLEEDLGCALFLRSGPQVRPTGSAVRLMPMVEELLTRMSAMKDALAALESRSERLVLRVPHSLAELLPTEMFAIFSECFPEVCLEVLFERGEQLLDFEIGYSDGAPADQIRRELVTEEIKMYVAPFHRLGQQSKASRSEVTQSLLIFSDSTVQGLVERELGKEFKCWVLPGVVAAREMAVQGQGIAFLPQWAVGNSMRDGSLVNVKFAGQRLERACCAWWDPTRPLTWMAQVFLSLLASELEAQAG
jgi:DNA-binding transcriptional LysR family regulator